MLLWSNIKAPTFASFVLSSILLGGATGGGITLYPYDPFAGAHPSRIPPELGHFSDRTILLTRGQLCGLPRKYLADASGDFHVPRKSTIWRSIPFDIFHVRPPIRNAYGATDVFDPAIRCRYPDNFVLVVLFFKKYPETRFRVVIPSRAFTTSVLVLYFDLENKDLESMPVRAAWFCFENKYETPKYFLVSSLPPEWL